MLAVEINIESKMYRLSVPIRPVIEDSLVGIRDCNGISELPLIQYFRLRHSDKVS